MNGLDGICKNCGADYGLHHYETNQCPVGGREAPHGRKQEWKSTTFEEQESVNELQELKNKLAEALARIDKLENMVKDYLL